MFYYLCIEQLKTMIMDFFDDDLMDAFEAMETGICPQCGQEPDNGTEDCENIIHDMM